MKLSRRRALALLVSAPALVRCGVGVPVVRVGSKNFTESILIAEIYAQVLERAGLHVERRFNLGSTQIAMAAVERGDIDLYPEYTGTALLNVLRLPVMRDPKAIYASVAREFAQRYDLIWLRPSPMNNSQALATTQTVARARRLTTLSDVAAAAPHLRLATIQEFLGRADGLAGLQAYYGGFAFEQVRTYDIALKYAALLTGAADVASAFSTDGAIDSDALVVLRDDRHFWPAYNVAPVVRAAALAREPRIATALDAIAPAITNGGTRRMNAAIESEHRDPADVAAAFLKASGH